MNEILQTIERIFFFGMLRIIKTKARSTKNIKKIEKMKLPASRRTSPNNTTW